MDTKIIDKVFNGCSKDLDFSIDKPGFYDRYISFICQTVVNERTGEWYRVYDKSNLTNDDIDNIISKSITKLLDISTSGVHDVVKMQVMIHDEIIQNTKDMEDTVTSKYRIISSDALSIANESNDDGLDDNSIANMLYQKMLNFVSSYSISGKIDDINTDKEIKAAFESVFPRSGVIAFINIRSTKMKMEQLMELAKIVLGIRLFNKNIGKGGYGIPNTDKEIVESVKSILEDIEDKITSIEAASLKRQKLIVKAILLKRKQEVVKELERRKLHASVSTDDTIMDDDILDMKEDYDDLLELAAKDENILSYEVYDDIQLSKWINELAFHKQYLTFLSYLFNSFKYIHNKVAYISNEIQKRHDDLNNLVGSKTVISKDVVYPKFLSLGNLWYECSEEALKYKYIKKSYEILTSKFDKSIFRTLDITDDLHGYLGGQTDIMTKTSRPSTYQTGRLTDETMPIVTISIAESKNIDPPSLTHQHKGDFKELQVADSKQVDDQFDDEVEGVGDSKQTDTRGRFDEKTSKDKIDSKQLSESQMMRNTSYKEFKEAAKMASQSSLPNLADSNYDIQYAENCFLLKASQHPEFEDALSGFNDPSIFTEPSVLLMEDSNNESIEKGVVINSSTRLKFEFNGYCPFTLIDKYGLMIPGDIKLGVVKYQDRYYLCENKVALKSFLKNPYYYLDKIRKLILNQPEYLMLLNHHKDETFSLHSVYLFPSPANPQVYQQYLQDIYYSSLGGRKFKSKCDASTETPTHFIERNMDPNYNWNEWDTRRQVIKIVNLTNCKTSSSQTANTHFRRDNQTQVYLPKENGTQTKRDKGTNPKIVTTYIAGLSGSINPNQPPQTYISKYVKEDDSSNSTAVVKKNGKSKETDAEKRTGSRVVTLTLDL